MQTPAGCADLPQGQGPTHQPKTEKPENYNFCETRTQDLPDSIRVHYHFARRLSGWEVTA